NTPGTPRAARDHDVVASRPESPACRQRLPAASRESQPLRAPWPSGLRSTRLLWSGNPGVPDLGRDVPLVVGEIVLLDRRDDRPVVADGAALEPPPAESDRLDRGSGNPDGREQMTLAAADDDVSTEAIPPQPSQERS